MHTLPARSDLTVQTHEALRAAIISGELSPCEPLAQEELAERLGVSRQPISHALKLLKQEGLVVDRGRKGQMVAPIDAERLLALYQVRGALDRLAAQLVANAAPLPSNTTDQLEQLIDQCSVADSNGDIASMVEADIAFHRLLHMLSGNSEIATATETLWPHIERAMHTVLEHHPVRSDIWREHRAIADAIIAGDALKAGELAAQHAEFAGANTHQRLLEIQTDTAKQI
jgi:DNA-binding GntR family transcriptional regulator